MLGVWASDVTLLRVGVFERVLTGLEADRDGDDGQGFVLAAELEEAQHATAQHGQHADDATDLRHLYAR